MPEHFRPVPGIETVVTDELTKLGAAMKSIVNPRSPSGLFLRGDFGCGKTFMTLLLLERLMRRPDAPLVVHFAARQSLTAAQLCREIGQIIDGCHWEGKAADWRRDVVPLLKERFVLIVLDEAHVMLGAAYTELRTIIDEPGVRVALMLIAAPPIVAKLIANGALLTRLTRDVEFKPKTNAEARRYLPELHDIFAGVDPKLLDEINRRAKGRYRLWNSFAWDAVELGVGAGSPLTWEAAETIWRQQGPLVSEVDRQDLRDHLDDWDPFGPEGGLLDG